MPSVLYVLEQARKPERRAMSESIVQERATSHDLIGSFRRFGPYGTAYEVLDVQGERATIRVVQSGETLEYPVEKLLLDPVA